MILSPGAMTMVVITPDKAPAAASCAGPSTLPSLCCKFFPIPKPMKLMEKEGMAMTIGAPMPANKNRVNELWKLSTHKIVSCVEIIGVLFSL